jgi:hypothetical protein
MASLAIVLDIFFAFLAKVSIVDFTASFSVAKVN